MDPEFVSETSNGVGVEVLTRVVTLLTNLLGVVMAFFDGSYYLFAWNLTSLTVGTTLGLVKLL